MNDGNTESKFSEMHDAYIVEQAHSLELEAELSKLKHKIQKDDHKHKIDRKSHRSSRTKCTFRAENEKVKQHYKELYDSIKITHAKTIEKTTSLLTKNEKLKGKMQCVTMDAVKPKVLAPGIYAIDVILIPPRNRNNREVHLDYLKHLKECVETLCEIVKEARIEKPLDNALGNTCCGIS
ncbi:hypothetical protein Tco_0922279 [Tanacetum coccineum]|uniref:Uncharacterized protein n=1 Tax=Tanacetum coccineum TaxID=301880 RepID=A0ABQ5CXN5_9ASTR